MKNPRFNLTTGAGAVPIFKRYWRFFYLSKSPRPIAMRFRLHAILNHRITFYDLTD